MKYPRYFKDASAAHTENLVNKGQRVKASGRAGFQVNVVELFQNIVFLIVLNLFWVKYNNNIEALKCLKTYYFTR